MPFKTFAPGSAATASDVNTYLMNQAVIVCTSGTRPSSPIDGMVIRETDTDRFLTYDGGTWNLPKNVAGGVLGYAEVTAAQTGITTEVDLTGLTVTATAGASRRIRVSAYVLISSTVAEDHVRLKIKEGAVELQYGDDSVSAARGDTIAASVVLSPSTGAHTYKLTMVRQNGTGSISLNAGTASPCYILVEDIGGV